MDGAISGRTIMSLCEYDSELYALCIPSSGLHWLLKWNGLNAWIKVSDCDKYAHNMNQMAVFNNKLWFGSYSSAHYIYYYDGVTLEYSPEQSITISAPIV